MRSPYRWSMLVVLATSLGSTAAQPQTNAPAPLTEAEIKVRAAKLGEDAVTDMRHATYVREQARKAQDIIKLTCINDVLVQMKAQLNILDLEQSRLDQVIDQGSDGQQAQFDKVAEAANTVRALRQEADACLGEPELDQETTVSVTSPDIVDDPTQDGRDVFDIEPPGYASPYR